MTTLILSFILDIGNCIDIFSGCSDVRLGPVFRDTFFWGGGFIAVVGILALINAAVCWRRGNPFLNSLGAGLFFGVVGGLGLLLYYFSEPRYLEIA